MPEKIKPYKEFLKDNQQVIYSITLMIIIPGVVILNTWFFSQWLRSTVDQSLQDKAVGISQVINVALADKLNSPQEIQTFINNWKIYNSDTQSLDILYRDNDNFIIKASFNENKIGVAENLTVYLVAWDQNWPVAQKIIDVNRNGEIYWLVAAPLKNLQGQKQALLSMRLSAGIVEDIVTRNLTYSFWVLIISVLLIVLLLFANSRLFGYSILYNKIKEIDEMKDEFISMASHELKTPVTIIRGYASMILEESQGLSEQTKNDLAVISLSAERLTNLIEDMLNVSRIEQGRLKIDAQPIEAVAVIEEIVKEMKIQADEKKLALTFTLEPNTQSLIKIDKDKFKQVLINLIGNSIKYTPSGSVEVKAFNRDKNLVILIKDTGIGMSAKEREHLFEKFYRVKNKKTEAISGTGLGLWITKQLVELMQGAIAIDSIENTGTQVTLEFPLVEAKANKSK
ncbi:MAG TPA: HAMP domain-containing sensor histidine kinase [Candidatus Pacearchaeota archaeon]|jgi:signal transduction histidine kinase|nr:HAMP domain-containing sensor histidine kinase [Candidatus Pacearchaeota archaeon]HQG09455.1 HAMP domain-containing sensor histidine kinase [Candidatus Pacearchaeota archaeon]HQH19975.1 HAMP domain-containing sensor histidine kinase [Candidatus Pacearchaeota archaeon]HQK58439.1 HAMP domain-containing sensor histidine kinase [Candidatus Pacearchaeota archaeon]